MERIKWGFAFLGGAVIWLINFLVIYAVGEFACVLEGSLFQLLGIGAAGWFLIVFSFGCIVISLYSMRMAWLIRKNSDAHFLSKAGLISNALFTYVILAQTMPILFLLNDC